MNRVAIYDLDGTIVCSLHRYNTINGKADLEFWRKYQHLCWKDTLLPLAQKYKEDVKDPSCIVIIATSRILTHLDYEFIQTHLGYPDHIVSREPDDETPGGLLKIKGLQKFADIITNAASVLFYEDNISYLKQVCDHFQIQGVYVPSKQGH